MFERTFIRPIIGVNCPAASDIVALYTIKLSDRAHGRTIRRREDMTPGPGPAPKKKNFATRSLSMGLDWIPPPHSLYDGSRERLE